MRMAPPRRHLAPPPLVCSPRASIDPIDTPEIDGVLKQLKACSRRLQAALACHRTELQVLERLYYKGKNQHRTALFWQRVAEMRKLGERVDEMHMDDAVESLRLAFWGDPSSRTPKLLKGPWTHCPDAKVLLFVMERCSACCTLVDRVSRRLPARERLLRAYESFTLMMQTGAFLQLVLALAAIASRLSLVLSEVRSALEVSWAASYRALQTLFPAEVTKVKKLVETNFTAALPPAPAPSISTFNSSDAVPEPGDVPDEDLGSALVRPPPPPQTTEENVTAFHADAATQSQPEEQPSDPVAYSLLHELARPIATTVSKSAESATGSKLVQPRAGAPKRKKAEDDKGKAVKKKKKTRDAIDDIFGF